MDKIENGLTPEFGACDQNKDEIEITIEGSDKVEDGDHENAFNGTVEVSQEQDTSVILFPSGKIEVTQRYNQQGQELRLLPN